MPYQQNSDDEIKATARRRVWKLRSFPASHRLVLANKISINLQAVPSFEAFGRFLKTANPFCGHVRRAACDSNGLGNAFQAARPSCGAAACVAHDGEPGGSDREHDAWRYS
jgi:hypothetical protein